MGCDDARVATRITAFDLEIQLVKAMENKIVKDGTMTQLWFIIFDPADVSGGGGCRRGEPEKKNIYRIDIAISVVSAAMVITDCSAEVVGSNCTCRNMSLGMRSPWVVNTHV